MKKTCLIFFCLFIGYSAVSQVVSPKYTAQIKKAVSFYHSRNYKNSGLAYSMAFKLNHWKGLPEDLYNAACAWAMAGEPDSAYAQLNHLVLKANFSDFNRLANEHDLISLQKEKKWKILLAQVQENADKKEKRLNKPLIHELDSIYVEDQKYRNQLDSVRTKYGFNSEESKSMWKLINGRDSTNQIRIIEIIEKYGWMGPDIIGENGSETLFLVIQHADLKIQEKYLPVMREAVKNGNAEGSDLALLEDRVAMREGKKQIYGSQIIQDKITGKATISPIEDEANVDKRRASVGLDPLAEYVKHWGIEYGNKPKALSGKGVLGNSDASTAMEIHDSVVSGLNVSKGFGKVQDFPGYSISYKEENSAWFKFSVDKDTTLTFDLVPENPKDDYDFILFKCPDQNCIDEIRLGVRKPERMCYSINYQKYGSTGLSAYESKTIVGAGPGEGYLSALPVKAGELCYLMVTYQTFYHWPPNGFTLYFYNYWPPKVKLEELKKMKMSKAIIRPQPLEKIFFETNKVDLLKESSVTLDKLVVQMNASKTLKIEIRGYTDNLGDEKRNKFLSENRARAVVDYLISKGIEKERLAYAGFGSANPIATNDTEEGREKNRRVEFVRLP